MAIRDWIGELAELLLPSACAGCRAAVPAATALCGPCDRSLQRIPPGRCSLCQSAPAARRQPRCTGCAASRGALSACIAAVWFEGAVPDVVHRFKYPRSGLAGLDAAATAMLRALVCEAGRRAPGATPDLVVPVPLHPRRLRARGFNPALELARALARSRRTRLDPTALRRVRDTPSQTGLNRRARRRNVRSAFASRPGWRAPARVWLVDDVVTTASTLVAAARTLRRAGARQVVAVCAARTPRP